MCYRSKKDAPDRIVTSQVVLVASSLRVKVLSGLAAEYEQMILNTEGP